MVIAINAGGLISDDIFLGTLQYMRYTFGNLKTDLSSLIRYYKSYYVWEQNTYGR